MPRYVHLDSVQGLGANAIENHESSKNEIKSRSWMGFNAEHYWEEDDVYEEAQEEPSLLSPENPNFSFTLGSVLVLCVATLLILLVICTMRLCQYFHYKKKREMVRRKIALGSKFSLGDEKPGIYSIWNARFQEPGSGDKNKDHKVEDENSSIDRRLSTAELIKTP